MLTTASELGVINGYLNFSKGWSAVWHPSNAAYGNFSFDIYSNYNKQRPHFYFIGIDNETNNGSYPETGYAFIIEQANLDNMKFELQ